MYAREFQNPALHWQPWKLRASALSLMHYREAFCCVAAAVLTKPDGLMGLAGQSAVVPLHMPGSSHGPELLRHTCMAWQHEGVAGSGVLLAWVTNQSE